MCIPIFRKQSRSARRELLREERDGALAVAGQVLAASEAVAFVGILKVAVALSLPSSSIAQVKAGLSVSPRQVSLPFNAVGANTSSPSVLSFPAALSITPTLASVPSIMPSPAPVTAATPIMKNSPKPVPAKSSLEALTAGLAKTPAAASAQAPLPPSSSGRLSKSVVPRKYDLRLRLDPENAAFMGNVKISLESRVPTKQLVLHALDLSLTSVIVAGRRLDPSKIVVDAKAETVTLLLDKPLKGRAEVEIEYSGKMNELMRGLYKSRGKNGKKDEAWSFTHLEPTHARRVLPSFDEPKFKAEFELTLDVPAGLTPLSNMPPVSDTVLDGRRTVVFQKTPKMSSYLLAVFAARLESRTRKVGKTVLTVWAAPDQIAQADFALDAGENALKYLNRYFAVPYMLPKLDMVAAPDFASGAMENWGAILYRDTSLLIDPRLSSDAAKRRVAEVVSHEIVHQWFGNLVTMGWWNDLWLNEAFATWLAYKVVDSWKPAWKVWDEFDQGKRSPLAIDALPGTRPVRSDAATPAEIQAQFDPMSYQKGGALLRMIEGYIGETAFRKGIQAYMKKWAYKNAEASDLARELELASGKPVRRMMDKWLSQGGVPVISVSAKRKTLTLTQSRFSAFDLKADTRWSIPVVIKYKLKGETKTRVVATLLETATKRVTLPGAGEVAWIYPNAGETGYYRFNLSPELLSAALSRRGDLSPVERAGLLNNSWAQVRAGQMPVDSFLDSLAAFRGDASRLIVEDAFGYLKTIRHELASNDAEREALGEFAADFFGPLAEKLAWDKKPGESQETTLTRPTVLNALALLAPKALDQEQVSARLKKYLADPSSIDSSLSAVILTAAARRDDPALFEAFRTRLAAPKTPEQKSLMLRALAEFTEPALLDTYLKMTLSDEIRAQDAWMPYAWLLSNPATRERAWSFVRANWKALSAKVGPRGGTRVIGAAGGLVSPAWKAEVESFFRAPENEIEMARKTLDQALESIGLGLRFKEGQSRSFRSWAR